MNLVYLVPLFPFCGFLLLTFSQGRWSETVSTIIGVGSIGVAALITFFIALDFSSTYGNTTNGTLEYIQTLWNWIVLDDFHISIVFNLNCLSLTMVCVVTGVGFFIQLYASWYMNETDNYVRFFAYTDLFIANMILLTLADNLLLIYLGWEGVGLCSYLLIGFYPEPKNGMAAMKAFIITRFGDVLLVFALFMLYNKFGTLNLQEIITLIPQKITKNSLTITLITLLLLGGAVGKSAQFPLQGWLADAMTGPTPASALIHAATMVTAGVYLIARTHHLFLMATNVLHLVGIIGAITLVLAGFTALVQTDIKRILAYSTMGQVGYMFLALGIQAWEAAIFHLVTHSFFKSLLFLAAGSVILACRQEQNIFRMGGLRKSMPLMYISFLIGGSSLSAFPLFTAGFFSKEDILWHAMANGHSILVIVGLLGSFITSTYTFRMIFLIFHGNEKIKIHTRYHTINYYLSFLTFLTLSTFFGAWMAMMLPLSGFFPIDQQYHCNYNQKLILEIVSSATCFAGILLAAVVWISKCHFIKIITDNKLGRFLTILWFHAWGFDWIYKKIFVEPYVTIARTITYDPVKKIIDNVTALLILWIRRILTMSENGQIRWYIASIGLGAIFVLLSFLIFI
ncbi:NADH-quinone oxidoreductase subunit L [Sodalis sp. CWE]|uniref:NADH-quinone oxidoreductase subunit L n=1 Tax=Sodalis sp. CWE TaxID=2803816 RepID=UPI001C7DD8E5|nr:NADH-quinone oxidoreductase subunit L [Sodalis sp. CWE]MBX4181070.1 NADH-quinone oxidoreductase subunit L [Sodalis sp. CWE]